MRQEVILLFALVACDRSSSVARRDPEKAQAQEAATVVDDATAPSCTVSYTCGLSHPGLGSSSRTTSVDLSTCTKTTASESRPFEAKAAPPPAASARKPPVASTLSSAECARVRAALTAVTQADARAAQESAHVDTEACSLTLQCKGDPAPRMDVQRQTMTGSTRVEALIRAVLGVGS